MQREQQQLLIVYKRFVFWAKFVRVSVVALSDFDNCMRSIDLPASQSVTQFVRGFCLSLSGFWPTLGLVLANLLKVVWPDRAIALQVFRFISCVCEPRVINILLTVSI